MGPDCLFQSGPCTKLKSAAKNGVCSILARRNGKEKLWSICPVRLHAATRFAIQEHFGVNAEDVQLVPEQVILDDPEAPRADFIAFLPGSRSNGSDLDVIAIEIQAVNVSGNVGKLYQRFVEGEEGILEGKVTVNLNNMFKYVSNQSIQKGGFHRWLNVPSYVIMQEANLEYIERRVPFHPVNPGDIRFLAVDFDADGSLQFKRSVGAAIFHGSNLIPPNPTFLEAMALRFIGKTTPEVARREFENRVILRAEQLGLYQDHVASLLAYAEEHCTCGHARLDHTSSGCLAATSMEWDEGTLSLGPACECSCFKSDSPQQPTPC